VVDGQVLVPRAQLRRLGGELAEAVRAVTEARASSDALEVLARVTVAIEELSATQHELVNLLLDHGHTWTEVGDALSTSAAAAERRYPRRRRDTVRSAASD
jgi:DNA-directed RNA polymerase specialized sigma24 family protein